MKSDLIEVSQFTLLYDGFFKIKFVYRDDEYEVKIYLPPAMLIKIFQNEGLENIESLDFCSEGLNFSKTTLILRAFYEDQADLSEIEEEYIDYEIIPEDSDYYQKPTYYCGFLTSDEAEPYQDSGHCLISCEIKAD